MTKWDGGRWLMPALECRGHFVTHGRRSSHLSSSPMTSARVPAICVGASILDLFFFFAIREPWACRRVRDRDTLQKESAIQTDAQKYIDLLISYGPRPRQRCYGGGTSEQVCMCCVYTRVRSSPAKAPYSLWLGHFQAGSEGRHKIRSLVIYRISRVSFLRPDHFCSQDLACQTRVITPPALLKELVQCRPL